MVIGSGDGNVYAWTLPSTVSDRIPWPMFHHDLQRTGLYTPPNQAPQITSYLPQDLTLSIDVSDSIDFSVTATDPENDPLSYVWKLDGFIQSTEDHWTYQTDSGSAGSHLVSVKVSDGVNTSNLPSISWFVTVNLPIETEPKQHNRRYLQTKRDKLGHILSKI